MGQDERWTNAQPLFGTDADIIGRKGIEKQFSSSVIRQIYQEKNPFRRTHKEKQPYCQRTLTKQRTKFWPRKSQNLSPDAKNGTTTSLFWRLQAPFLWHNDCRRMRENYMESPRLPPRTIQRIASAKPCGAAAPRYSLTTKRTNQKIAVFVRHER